MQLTGHEHIRLGAGHLRAARVMVDATEGVVHRRSVRMRGSMTATAIFHPPLHCLCRGWLHKQRASRLAFLGSRIAAPGGTSASQAPRPTFKCMRNSKECGDRPTLEQLVRLT